MRQWMICSLCQGYGHHVKYVGRDCLRDKAYDVWSCEKCKGTGLLEVGKKPFKDTERLNRQEIFRFMKTIQGHALKQETHRRYVFGRLLQRPGSRHVCPFCKEAYYYHPLFKLCDSHGKPISHAKGGWLREYSILCSGQVVEHKIHPDYRQKA